MDPTSIVTALDGWTSQVVVASGMALVLATVVFWSLILRRAGHD